MDIKIALTKLKSFILECRRVLKITRKPTKQEFKTIVKASALGMAIIGAIGFLMHIIRQIFIPPVV
jgi:protein transport protein SEC61 subunit gamma-like protein